MADELIGMSRLGYKRAESAAAMFALAAALLGLDNQLGPLSFTLRRAIALVVLAVIAGSRIGRGKSWPIAGWAGIIATLALVARAPSVPVALLGFILALAAIE